MAAVELQGQCDARFKRVREIFEASFASGAELGAGLCVYLNGRLVIDLWGGFANHEKTRPWRRDTLANVYSTTKGITALCAHQLVERGQLDLDAPVARYWPEFAQNGKAEIPVRMLLSHRAGLPAIAKPLQPTDIFDWNTMTSALAEQKSWWTPGTKHGYHALTFGWLVGELVRRVSGMSIGRYVREHVAAPLGAEFWIGLPEELDARTADLAQGPIQTGEGQPNMLEIIQKDPEGMLAKTFANPLLFALLLACSSLASALKVSLPLASSGSTMSVSYAVDFAALLLLGADETMLVAGASAFSQCTFRTQTRSAPYRTLFSMASLVLTVKAAGWAYTLLGGTFAVPFTLFSITKPLVGAATTYFVFNTLFIATAIGLSTRQKIVRVWNENFLWSAPSYFVGALAAAIAASVIDRGGYWMASLAAAPLYLTYRTYKVYMGRIQDQQRHVAVDLPQQLFQPERVRFRVVVQEDDDLAPSLPYGAIVHRRVVALLSRFFKPREGGSEILLNTLSVQK
jgi:CubicO group peptidase (beta-lactamase class C family)